METAFECLALPVTSPDGHRSQLLTLVPPDARAALLFVPALGVPARKYLAFARALAAQGIAVALHELRGLDTSDWRAGWDKDWGYRELLADLSVSRAALATRHPHLRWRLGGHSLGAQLAALSMVQERAPSGLAIVASGQPWWRRFPLWRRPFVLGVFLWFRGMSLLCGHFPGETVGFGGREARGVIRDWTRTGISGRYAIRDVGFDFERALAETSEPVLALRMAHDPLVPRGSLDHLLAKLPRAQVTRDEIVPAEFERGRADHFAWMKDPGPVVRRIATWAIDGANAR